MVRAVGVLGGTFDPIHWGHLLIAEEARVRLGLDKVLLVPARNQWRKTLRHGAQESTARQLTEAADRLSMVRAAIADNPAFEASTVDLDRPGLTYTVDTLEDLSGDHDLYFILGMDSLLDLPFWREPDRIARLARLAAAVRPGYELDWGVLEKTIPDARERIVLLAVPEIGISSTAVRQRVEQGLSLRYWVPGPVAAYIQERGLYRTEDNLPGSQPAHH